MADSGGSHGLIMFLGVPSRKRAFERSQLLGREERSKLREDMLELLRPLSTKVTDVLRLVVRGPLYICYDLTRDITLKGDVSVGKGHIGDETTFVQAVMARLSQVLKT